MNRKSVALLLMVFFYGHMSGSEVPSFFKQYAVKDGLSHSLPNTIMQTSDGYIWIGTQDGLNRFDGNEFKVFHPVPFDTTSISGSGIITLFEASNKELFVVTNEGLNIYDPYYENFTRVNGDFEFEYVELYEPATGKLILKNSKNIYVYDNQSNTLRQILSGLPPDFVLNTLYFFDKQVFFGTNNGLLMLDKSDFLNYLKSFETIDLKTDCQNSGIHSDIRSIHRDRSGNFWIGTFIDGLFYIDNDWQKDGMVQAYTRRNQYIVFDPVIKYYLAINTIHEDKNGTVWLATRNGIVETVFSQSDTTFRYHFNEKFRLNHMNQNNVGQIFEDQKGNLWMIPYNNEGVYFYDIKLRQFSIISRSTTNYTLPTNRVRQIMQDNTGVIWLTTIKEGICIFHYNWNFFRNIVIEDRGQKLNVYSINQLNDDSSLIIGTDNGLVFYDVNRNIQTAHYKHDPNDKYSIGANLISSVQVMENNQLWLGYLDGQLSTWLPDDNKFLNWRYDQKDIFKFEFWTIQDIISLNSEEILLAANLQLIKFNTKSYAKKLLFDDETDKRVQKGISSLVLQDSALWIGTNKSGLLNYDLRTESFGFFSYDPYNKKGLSSNNISCLFYDSADHSLWIGTFGGGINVMDLHTKKVFHLSEQEGLSNNTIQGMVKDSRQRFWFSTNHGISMYDLKSGKFTNFYAQDGMFSNEFNPNAYFLSQGGNIYFGYSGGITCIDPLRELPRDIIPESAISKLVVADQIVNPGDRINNQLILNCALEYQDTVIFSHRNNDFSFYFTSFYFPSQRHLVFKYKLEGFHENWKLTTYPLNMATFTGLPDGTYKLLLKVITPHGIESALLDQKTIIILPPWYKTLWFRILLTFFVLILVTFTIALRTFRIRQRNKLLERLVAERTSEIEEEKERIMDNFNQVTLIQSSTPSKRNVATRDEDELKIFDAMDLRFEGLSSDDQAFLTRFVGIIHKNLADPEIGISDISSQMAMSRATLHNHIKKATGKSATEFIRLYKIVSGATFLKKGYSISETLYHIGINSRSYFNKCFKEIYGITPSEFLKDS